MNTVYEIPVRDLDEQIMTVFLDGELYKLRLCYNNRQASWTIDMLGQDGAPMIQGMKIVTDWVPFRGIRIADLPLGTIVIIDRKRDGATPDRNSLGLKQNSGLMYVSAGI